MTFTCLEQRMAQSCMDMLPSFAPDKKALVSACEQEQFYTLIKRLYQLAFDEPLLFVTSLHEDDAYPHRYKKGYEKPKLITDMRKFTQSVDGLLQAMFSPQATPRCVNGWPPATPPRTPSPCSQSVICIPMPCTRIRSTRNSVCSPGIKNCAGVVARKFTMPSTRSRLQLGGLKIAAIIWRSLNGLQGAH